MFSRKKKARYEVGVKPPSLHSSRGSLYLDARPSAYERCTGKLVFFLKRNEVGYEEDKLSFFNNPIMPAFIEHKMSASQWGEPVQSNVSSRRQSEAPPAVQPRPVLFHFPSTINYSPVAAPEPIIEEEGAIEEAAIKETAIKEAAIEETAIEEAAIEEAAIEEGAIEEAINPLEYYEKQERLLREAELAQKRASRSSVFDYQGYANEVIAQIDAPLAEITHAHVDPVQESGQYTAEMHPLMDRTADAKVTIPALGVIHRQSADLGEQHDSSPPTGEGPAFSFLDRSPADVDEFPSPASPEVESMSRVDAQHFPTRSWQCVEEYMMPHAGEQLGRHHLANSQPQSIAEAAIEPPPEYQFVAAPQLSAISLEQAAPQFVETPQLHAISMSEAKDAGSGTEISSGSISSGVLRQSQEFLEDLFSRMNCSDSGACEVTGIQPAAALLPQLSHAQSELQMSIAAQTTSNRVMYRSSEFLGGAFWSAPVSPTGVPSSPRTIRGERIKELVERFERQ